MIRRMNEKLIKMTKGKEALLVVFLSALLVFGITAGIGTLTCGWHLIDDHEFLRWFYELKFEGRKLTDMIREWIIRDLDWRYEPLYYTNRILSCALFGINLEYYSILKSVEVFLSYILLYYCGRLMGGGKVNSFLFAAVSLTGYQSAVWWKLGPQEAQCTLLFAAGFYCMLKWLDKNRMSWAAGSLIAFLAMCNYKESFIILVPFLLLYVLYYDIEKGGGEISWAGVWKYIKSRLWYYLILGFIFTAIISVIVFYVGVNDYDMVGLDASVPWKVYVEAFQDALRTDLKWYYRFGVLFFMILLTYWEKLKKMWKEILLTAAFLLPQIVIFGQAGIKERYILPSAIGFSMFFIILVQKKKILSGKRKMVYQLGIILLLMAHGRVALREADYFRYRGESITTMLETVREMSQGEENILSCFRPNEEGNLVIHFWMAVHGLDNVYFWTEEDRIINKVYDNNFSYDAEYYEEKDFEEMAIVVMYNKEDRHWCYEPSLDLSDFTEIKCGTLNIYVRNGCGIEPIFTEIEGARINI